MTTVFAVEEARSGKVGPVSATYAAQQSCPRDCAFLGNGCYAENGHTALYVTRRLNRADPSASPLDVALREAELIDGLSGERDLRLHIVGDCATVEATLIVSAAAERYMDRGGRRAWTYTHAWRDVPRWAWGRVSVLASCETPADVVEANRRGCATALTVLGHPGERRYDAGPLRILPCPEQTRGVTCAECRLCTDDAGLRARGLTIAFALHGGRSSIGKATRALAERRREMAGV